MTGTEICAAAAAYIDDEIDDTDALIAINEAMDRLGDMALVYDSASVTLPACAWTALENEFASIVELTDSDGIKYNNYRVIGNEIKTSKADTFTVRYRRMPHRLTALAETPELHTAFHPVLVIYLKSWARLKLDSQDEDGLALKQEFFAEAKRVSETVLRIDRKYS
jgi:hypothetical protein